MRANVSRIVAATFALAAFVGLAGCSTDKNTSADQATAQGGDSSPPRDRRAEQC
nr:hypothetical protein GCM10020063_102180 [Dactylosporangium thailandense]